MICKARLDRFLAAESNRCAVRGCAGYCFPEVPAAQDVPGAWVHHRRCDHCGLFVGYVTLPVGSRQVIRIKEPA